MVHCVINYNPNVHDKNFGKNNNFTDGSEQFQQKQDTSFPIGNAGLNGALCLMLNSTVCCRPLGGARVPLGCSYCEL
eukprot:1504427-Amphidinium_carterae.1